MTEAGGPTPPDRTTRFELYRRHEGERLRALDKAALVVGAPLGLIFGLLLLWFFDLVDDGPVPVRLGLLLLSVVAGAGYVRQSGLRRFDTVFRSEFALPDLPRSDRYVVQWASASDLAEVAASIDDEVLRTMRWTALDRIDRIVTLQIPGFVVESLRWTVRDAQTWSLIACIGTDNDQADPTVASVGIWLAPEARGQGRAAGILALVVPAQRAVLRSFEVEDQVTSAQVTLATDVDNIAMQRAALRAGGEEIGRYEHRFSDGSTSPAVRYRFRETLTPAELETQRAAWPMPRSLARLPKPMRPVSPWVFPALAAGAALLFFFSFLATKHGEDQSSRAPVVPGTTASEPPTPDTEFDPTDETVLERGAMEDAEFRITAGFGRDGTTRLTIEVHGPGSPPTTTVATDRYATDIAADKVAVGAGGSYVLAIVPLTTASVRYQPMGREAIDLPLIELVDRPGEATVQAVAAPVPDQIDDWTLTATDELGHETTYRSS